MHADAFTEISLVIGFALAVSAVLRVLRQPLIIGYILTGILVGPAVFDLVHSDATFDVLASFGIALLLFVVGLGLNPKVVREVGRVAVITGVGQVLFTSLVGFAITKLMGFPTTAGVFISVALAFSSTIIVLKLLTDKKEQNRLYGKISIGFLLVQDLIATFALVFASATGSGGLSASEIGELVAQGAAIAAGLAFISIYVLPRFNTFLASSQEFLFLFAISWGFGVGALVLGAGFSLEVGALFAGVALASMPYAQEVASRLKPLRDFFIVLFFIALGARLNLDSFMDVLPEAVLLSVFVLVGNPLIVTAMMGLLGYTRKTAFKTSLAVAQISEFSLVFILLGQRTGQVDDTVVALVTVVGLITIAISSYMIIYADQLFAICDRYLSLFERRKTRSEHTASNAHELVLFGYHKGGQEYVKTFEELGKRFVVVDYDPLVADQLSHGDVPFIYGDATDVELLEEIGLEHTQLAVSTLSDHATNVFLAQHIEQAHPSAVFVCHAETLHEAAELYELGATYVLLPHYLGNEKIASFIKRKGLNKSEFKKFREQHLKYVLDNLDKVAE